MLLLAAMIVIGFVIEAVVYDRIAWLTKLPLIVMLGLAFVRSFR